MARILIVEDEPDIALGLQLDLQDEGHVVEVLNDGEQASRRAREPGWDLILLDVMLPRKDGFEIWGVAGRQSAKLAVVFAGCVFHRRAGGDRGAVQNGEHRILVQRDSEQVDGLNRAFARMGR